MSKIHLLQYLLVITISLAANWFVQMTYYYYEINRNPHSFDGLKVLFDYKTGVIGDVFILPIINVLVLFIFHYHSFKPTLKNIFYAASAALLADALLHFFQGKLNIINWSMPQPFHWNFVSYWHMVSLFFQLTYLFLFLYLLLKNRHNIKDLHIETMVVTIFFLMLVFLFLLIDDYNWVKIFPPIIQRVFEVNQLSLR